MKLIINSILAAAALVAATGSLNAQSYSRTVTARQIGGTTFYSNGVSARQIGGTTFYSNGMTARQIGGTTYFNNVPTCPRPAQWQSRPFHY